VRSVALALLVACGSTTAKSTSDWHGDLAALVTELGKHPNKSVETAWRGAARDLDAQLDKLDDAHALILARDGSGALNLETVDLP